jgi:glycerol kinase
MAVMLALDQGTTSSRAIVFDRDGTPISIAQQEFPQLFPQPGWVEHDPEDIWRTQYETACEALSRANALAEDVVAIGITNQRETALLWDRVSGKPVANAIVWQDRRTTAMCENVKTRGLEDTIRARTGLLADPYFSATKIAWLLDKEPGLRERAERGEIAFGTVDSWLIWKLTAGARHLTDMTNASRTLLFDIHTLSWSDELCGMFDVPKAVLPDVLPCTADFGTTDAVLFGKPIRICGVAGDQQAALIGQAGFAPGLAKNTYGTGSFLMLNTGADAVTSRNGLLSTVAFAFDRANATYALEGSVFITGAAVQWLRDGLGLIEHAADIEALAKTVRDNGGVYFVPAFTGLGAPHWDPHARGTIAGITRGTTRGHIARATLEAIAYQTAEVIDAMQSDSGVSLAQLRVDGGGSVNNLTMQFQSDVLGVPVVRPRVTETTALGAAYLAGLHSGFWPSVESVASNWREERRFEPAMQPPQIGALLEGWRRAVASARA